MRKGYDKASVVVGGGLDIAGYVGQSGGIHCGVVKDVQPAGAPGVDDDAISIEEDSRHDLERAMSDTAH